MLRALHDKGVGCERVASLDNARGKFLVVAGLASGDGPAARLLKSAPAAKGTVPFLSTMSTWCPQKSGQSPEALVIRKLQWHGKPVWLVAGADSRGLMYAELDVADRIGWAADRQAPLSEIRDIAEKPDAPERASPSTP